jgi:hypothetical protein
MSLESGIPAEFARKGGTECTQVIINPELKAIFIVVPDLLFADPPPR